MKSAYSIFILSIFLFFVQFSIAQEYKDCETAINLCGESPFYFNTSFGVGETEPEIEETCVLGEHSSTWVSWTVMQGGTLTFVLTPDSTVFQDLDFIVFKIDGNCEEKEIVRCMASGEVIGAPFSSWENCTGPTGLSFGETDTEELPGCDIGDNNFLAPLETNQGEQYVVLVNDFSDSELGFSLSFGGTAILDCITVSTDDLKDELSILEIYPSPSSGVLYVKVNFNKHEEAKLTIFDMYGRKVYSEKSLNKIINLLDLTHLPAGQFIASLQQGKREVVRRLLIFR